MPQRATPSVLVVDDNPEVTEAVAYHLGTQGIDVRVAHDAATAEAEVARIRPDALVVDLLLPDRTGHRLLGRLSRLGTRRCRRCS